MQVFAQAISLVRHRCVLHEDKISWPTRGPNVGWTIGSTMRRRPASRAEKPCKSGRSEELVAARRGARLGLSRRRSRVRVPSLPLRFSPATQGFASVGLERRVEDVPHKCPKRSGVRDARAAQDRCTRARVPKVRTGPNCAASLMRVARREGRTLSFTAIILCRAAAISSERC
jgi:hypothetical protein